MKGKIFFVRMIGLYPMIFSEYRITQSFNPDLDKACAHCMISFKDEDEISRCPLTDHLTHASCVGHDA